MGLSKNLWLSVLTLAMFQVGQAQIASQQAPEKPAPGYIASYWKNGVALIKSPVHWRADEWARAGSGIAFSGIILSMDEPLSKPFFNWNTNIGNDFGKTTEVLGHGLFQVGFSGAALGLGALIKKPKLKSFALDNLQAQIFTLGATGASKLVFRRSRPINNQGPYTWFAKPVSSENFSFFSGHSSLSFTTATMIFLHSKKKWWVGVLSYGVATGISLGRLQMQKHWASDVVVGALAGAAMANFVYNQQEKNRRSAKIPKPIP